MGFFTDEIDRCKAASKVLEQLQLDLPVDATKVSIKVNWYVEKLNGKDELCPNIELSYTLEGDEECHESHSGST